MEIKKTDYATLHQLIQTQGLLDKNISYYLFLAIFLLALAIGIGYLLVFLPPTLKSALFLGFLSSFLSVQLGFIGHDISHYQIFYSPQFNRLAEIFQWNLLLGLSSSWWRNQHNAHHFYSNESVLDPSINLSIFSFSQRQFTTKNSFQRKLIRYQAWLFFPLTAFAAFYMRVQTIFYLSKNRSRYHLLEVLCLIAHQVIYCLVVFSTFNLQNGIIFIVTHNILMGIYINAVFAPNHKGMPVIDKDDPLFKDFLRRQIITSRNIRSNLLVNTIYGGLEFQIEHHLFETMPRRNLKKASTIVKSFCLSHGISYYETGIWQSYKEIIGHLQKQSYYSV